ncbi:MAG: radical SAM protein [Propionivibrio sp.]
MDVLLVNTPLFEAGGQVASYSEPPPLGLGYIGTALRRQGFETSVVDAIAEGMSVEQLCQLISTTRAKYLGLNVFSTNIGIVEKIATSCHSSHVLVGGPGTKALRERILAWSTPSALSVFVGEAEHALPALLNQERMSPSEIGTVIPAVVNVSPDSSWFPCDIDLPLDRSLFRHDPVYEPRWGLWETHLLTSRGCGHNCAFCGAARSANPGQVIRFRSEESISSEIDDVCANHLKVGCVRLLDDLFLRNPRFIERAIRIFSPRKLKWRAMAHVSGLSQSKPRVFQQLATSGCLELFVGIESGSPHRRRLIGKPADVSHTWYVVTNLLNSGVAVKAYFIFGFPGEEEEEMQETYALACRLAQYAQHSPGRFRVAVFKFRPYHGTRLYDELVESGITPQELAEDFELATMNGRSSYGFTGQNYSAVPTEHVNHMISLTLKLNS